MNQTNTSKRIPTQINEFRGDYAFLSNFYPAETRQRSYITPGLGKSESPAHV